MEEEKQAGNTGGDIEEKKATEEDRLKMFLMLIGKFHEGISQLGEEEQDMMLRKHNDAIIEATLAAMERISGRDPRTFTVDEMRKHHEPLEQQYSKGKATITREGNVMTWRSNIPYCYDPKVEHEMIKPYPNYCKQCNQFFFESLYGLAHKGPVKVEGVKSVIRGDDMCETRVEFL